MTDAGAEPRRLSAPLLVGILCAPALFGWSVLRRGYARTLRQAVLIYAVVIFGVGFVGRPSVA